MAIKKNREQKMLSVLKALGIISFIIAAIVIAVFIVMQIETVQEKYSQFLKLLEDFEYQVAALQNKWLILIVIFLLYLLRSLSAFFPYTVIHIITAMVFSPFQSLIINICGMAFTLAFRYYTGWEMGEGTFNNIIKKYPSINASFEQDGKFNSLMLLALRLVSVFPFNTISHLYGSYKYPFKRYMLLSLVAILPKLISYSFIGNNVWDPLSGQFFIPIVILCIFSGCSLFFLRGIMKISLRITKNKSSERTNEDE